MLRKSALLKNFMALAASLFLCLPDSAAFAEPYGIGPLEKGYTAAQSTQLDRSLYADGSRYENPPAELETVRIGIDYGKEAVGKALFKNFSGGGFALGYYAGGRSFIELFRTEKSSVEVSFSAGGGSWHILIDGEYESRDKAEIAALAYGGFTREIDGKHRVLYGSYSSRAEAEKIRDRFRLPGTAYCSEKGRLSISSGGEIIFSAEEGETALALLPLEGEKGLTEYGGERYHGGFECALNEAGMLNVINCVELEDYVKGVIPYEMSYAWPYEALKAQAVCARTYAVYNQDKYAEMGFDLTDDTESQVYRGTKEANELSDSAVDSTAGQLVRWRGEICEVYYFASDGGATEDGINVFDADRPYLTGKPDPFEQAVDFTGENWSTRRSGENIAGRLKSRGYEIGTVCALQAEYSDTGNVIAISFTDIDGNNLRIQGRECYTTLGLSNCRFHIAQEENSFTFAGSGWGHNCGMSQWGANAMASVYGYDYEDIIRFYFTGAYIA